MSAAKITSEVNKIHTQLYVQDLNKLSHYQHLLLVDFAEDAG